MRFAALGRTKMLLEGIRACHAAGHQPTLIGTCAAAPEYSVTEADFESLAEEMGVPFFNDPSINRPELIKLARDSGAEVAISVNWLTMIGREVRDQFEHGVVNAHPGDLPRYRGNACPNWAIIKGEGHIAATLHEMTDELDAGPILMKRQMQLAADTYIFDVYTWLERNVPEMFVDLLDALQAGTVRPTPQPEDPAAALRCHPRRPSDGLIDWNLPAELIARLVRASAEPFAGAFSLLEARRLTVWRAHPEALPMPSVGVPGQVTEIRRDSGEVTVLTGDGLLAIEEAELEGDGRGPPTEMIGSTRTRLGIDPALLVDALRGR